MTSFLSTVGLLAFTFGAVQAQNCKRIMSCVPSHQKDYATSYCSSYLGITAQTSTASASVSVVTVTSTSTTTVIDDSVYQTCGPGNNKAKRATKTHSKPFCLRAFTQPTALSKACQCLDIPTTTSTITATPSSTTTTTVTTVSTSSSTEFYMIDSSNHWMAWQESPGEVFFASNGYIAAANATASLYYLDDYGGESCVLHDSVSGDYLVAADGQVQLNSTASGPPVVCTLNNSGGSGLSCAAGNLDRNVFYAGGGDNFGQYGVWSLANDTANYYFDIDAYAELS